MDRWIDGWQEDHSVRLTVLVSSRFKGQMKWWYIKRFITPEIVSGIDGYLVEQSMNQSRRILIPISID